MKYLIDTVAGTCVPYEANKMSTIADEMEACLGAKEWDETVTKIQKRFYGYLSKTAWCATGLSYFSSLAGKLEQTGMFENVDDMKEYMDSRNMLDCTKNYGGGHYQAKRGDVVFMSSKYNYLDCTHVGVVSEINHHTGQVTIISCNHNNAIGKEIRNYLTDKYVVAWGRVD